MKKNITTYQLLLIGLLFCFPIIAFAQKRVTGTVTDSLQVPIPGASVSIKGAGTGTRTNNNGQFTIDVNEGQTLVVSFVGYEPLEVQVSSSPSTLDLSLRQSNTLLTDVVVVGYGTQRRQNLTGAISSISSERLESRPITNVGSGLQGMVPNLNISRGNGAPGQGAGFNIRGSASINAGVGDPLVLVDGVQTDPKGYIRVYTNITNRVWDDKMYFYPIPAQEILLNPQLTQNQGW